MRGLISARRFLFAAVVAAAASMAAFAQTCPGEPGCLDESFGSAGILQVSMPNSIRATVWRIATHTDGSVVALFDNLESDNVNRPVMARFFEDGTLDTGFGGGFVYLNWPSVGSGGPKNVAVQSDGKVVVVGYSPLGRNATALRLHRYNYDGTLDGTFGSGGVAAFNLAGAITLLPQPGGKILMMNADGKLIRLNASGSLDATFGSGGIASPKFGLSPSYDGLAVLPSGKIVATGHTVVAGLYQFTIAGYNANGSLDDGSRSDSTPGDRFGSKGSVIVSLPGYSSGRGYAVRVDSSGRLVAMGAAGTQNTTVALARLSSSGQLDASFAGTGKLVFDYPPGAAQGSALELQSDGRIVVIGRVYYPEIKEGDAMVLRFTEQGANDLLVLHGPSGYDESCVDGAIMAGDRILCAGMIGTEPGTVRIPLMMRFLP